jgi:hypothetical protein
MEWSGVDWIHLAQDRYQWRPVVNTLNEPSGSMKVEDFFN